METIRKTYSKLKIESGRKYLMPYIFALISLIITSVPVIMGKQLRHDEFTDDTSPLVIALNSDCVNYLLVAGITVTWPMRSTRMLLATSQQIIDTRAMFIRYVSKDVSDPMKKVLHNLKLLADDMEMRTDVTWDDLLAVDRMRDTCMSAVSALENLIIFDKLENGILDPVMVSMNAWSFLRDIARPFRGNVDGTKVEVSFPTEVVEWLEGYCVYVDKESMCQAFRTVVKNARNTSPTGGVVLVSARRLSERPIVDNNNDNDNDSISSSRVVPEIPVFIGDMLRIEETHGKLFSGIVKVVVGDRTLDLIGGLGVWGRPRPAAPLPPPLFPPHPIPPPRTSSSSSSYKPFFLSREDSDDDLNNESTRCPEKIQVQVPAGLVESVGNYNYNHINFHINHTPIQQDRNSITPQQQQPQQQQQQEQQEQEQEQHQYCTDMLNNSRHGYVKSSESPPETKDVYNVDNVLRNLTQMSTLSLPPAISYDRDKEHWPPSPSPSPSPRAMAFNGHINGNTFSTMESVDGDFGMDMEIDWESNGNYESPSVIRQSKRKIRVLIVDDNEREGKTLARVLRWRCDQCHTVTGLSDAVSNVTDAMNNNLPYDIVMWVWDMSQAQSIRSAGYLGLIIGMVTVKVGDKSVLDGVSRQARTNNIHGVDHVVSTPVDIEELEEYLKGSKNRRRVIPGICLIRMEYIAYSQLTGFYWIRLID
eukprot:gene10239-21355_t